MKKEKTVSRTSVRNFLRRYAASVKKRKFLFFAEKKCFDFLAELTYLLLQLHETRCGVTEGRLAKSFNSDNKLNNELAFRWCLRFLLDQKLVKKTFSQQESYRLLIPCGRLEGEFGVIRRFKAEERRRRMEKRRLEREAEKAAARDRELLEKQSSKGWRNPAISKKIREEVEAAEKRQAEERARKEALEKEEDDFWKAAKTLARQTGRYIASDMPPNPTFTSGQVAEVLRDELSRIRSGGSRRGPGKRPHVVLVKLLARDELIVRWDIIRRLCGEEEINRLKEFFGGFSEEVAPVGGDALTGCNDSSPLSQQLKAAVDGGDAAIGF